MAIILLDAKYNDDCIKTYAVNILNELTDCEL